MEVMNVNASHLDSRCSTPDLPDLPKASDRMISSPLYETVATVLLSQVEDSPTQNETVATLPLYRSAITQNANTTRLTQPTQLINQSSPDLPTSPPPVVQVVASSPMTSVRRQSGILASVMAPAGTSFRRPFAPPRPQPRAITLDSDDEGPTYNGGSSDSDLAILKRNDIKTSIFEKRNKDIGAEKIPESPQTKPGLSKFHEITANSFYKPTVFNVDPRIRNPNNQNSRSFNNLAGVKRSSDTMASAYGNASKRRQIAPARAQPVEIEQLDMELDDIMDPNMRKKTKHVFSILTTETIRSCYEALVAKKGNTDDAIDYLLLMSDKKANKAGSRAIDLTGSEDELLMTPAPRPISRPNINLSRQQAKKPAISIHDKWSSTQNVKKAQSKQLNASQEQTKKKGKLVRGRKERSSPVVESPKALPNAAIQIDSDNSENDSGIHSSPEDKSFDSRLLAFFNTCSANDLSDTAGISLEIAGHLISKRPFKSLDSVCAVETANARPGRSKRRPPPIGERIVEKCEEMLRSYEAVDFLVKKCENIAKPLANDMKRWGVNIYGVRDSELDILSLKDSQWAGHDSGIGTPASDLGDERSNSVHKNGVKYITPPSIMSDDIQMKDYQVVGINWLALLFKRNLSCILADDMGLGKTCQVIAFLAWLFENGEKGPHLVVVPAATLENWLKEFQRFCPTLNVEPYYANNPSERLHIAAHIDSARDGINVVITTYTVAKGKDDFPWLKHFGFCCTVFDEGHILKNADSQVASKLVRIESKFRLLLTGTPLQNNLKELISLLAFLMPSMFREKKDELQSIFSHNVKAMDANHEALLSAQRIARARSMLTPFILRRKKYQVLKDLPKKERKVEYCDMTPEQSEIYSSYLEKALDIRTRRANGENVSSESTNILMKLRQAAIHPFLFRRCYKDKQLPSIAKACLRDPQWAESNPNLIVQELEAYSDMEIHSLCDGRSVLQHFTLNNHEWLASGKVQKMLQLLRRFMAEGHRTLVFSQFTMVLDILELVLEREVIAYFRLDGTTKVAERQDLIDEFCSEENQTPVFMLSTKAGGAGINLAKANKVIVFDSGFNPQDDIQAENRAHRIGQMKEVEVVRLVSKGTVEEQIYAMGLTKLKLDEQVAGDGDANEAGGKEDDEKREAEGRKAVEELFWKKLDAESVPDEKSSAADLEGTEEQAIHMPEQFEAGLQSHGEVEVRREEQMCEKVEAGREREQNVKLPSRTRQATSRKPSRVKIEVEET
jgi:SWI/SNF-related matrix-associated actin-dependent regulator of chromatin subfamily A containing DEAD/H box 1